MDQGLKQLIGGTVALMLLFTLTTWCAWSCGNGLRRMLNTEMAVNRAMGEVHRHDEPTLYYIQLVGYILLMVISGVMAAYSTVAFIHRLANIE
jgi:hypothetical protein